MSVGANIRKRRFELKMSQQELADAMGYQKVFIVSAVICAVSFAVFAPYYLRRKPLNGEN